jgi:DNA-directed RNA polymerase subunit F
MIENVAGEGKDISPQVVGFLMSEIAELRIINEAILELLPKKELDITVLISNRIKQKTSDIEKRLIDFLSKQG